MKPRPERLERTWLVQKTSPTQNPEPYTLTHFRFLQPPSRRAHIINLEYSGNQCTHEAWCYVRKGLIQYKGSSLLYMLNPFIFLLHRQFSVVVFVPTLNPNQTLYPPTLNDVDFTSPVGSLGQRPALEGVSQHRQELRATCATCQR